MAQLPSFFSTRTLLLAPLVLLAPALAQATLDDARESLLQNSPFIQWQPPKPVVRAPVAPITDSGNLSREIDFKGILKIGEETYFNVFDKVENKSVLIGMNESRASARFKVVDYNGSGDRSIRVQSGNGPMETIYLAASDGVSIPTATAQPMPSRPTPAVLGGNTAVIGGNTANTSVINRTAPAPSSERRRRVIPRRLNSTGAGGEE